MVMCVNPLVCGIDCTFALADFSMLGMSDAAKSIARSASPRSIRFARVAASGTVWMMMRLSAGNVPLFHVTGCNSQFLTQLALGGTSVVMPRFDPASFLRAIPEHRITLVTSVPTIYELVLRHPDLATTDVSSVQVLSYGGAPIAPELVRRLMRAFPAARLGNGFGLRGLGLRGLGHGFGLSGHGLHGGGLSGHGLRDRLGLLGDRFGLSLGVHRFGLGLVGALVGYWIFAGIFGIGDEDKFDWGGIVGALIGAILVVAIGSWLFRKSARRPVV